MRQAFFLSTQDGAPKKRQSKSIDFFPGKKVKKGVKVVLLFPLGPIIFPVTPLLPVPGESESTARHYW
jgi:hypothetical protein